MSGVVVGGIPGSGKSQAITSWLCQLAPSPASQVVCLDGKGGDEFGDFGPRLCMSGDDDLEAAVSKLEWCHDLMRWC